MVISRWQDAAQCKGQEDIFFGDGRSTFYEKAEENCRVCQVSAYCRASSIMETEGYWAGLPPRVRGKMRATIDLLIERDEHVRPALNRACDKAYENGEDPEPYIAEVLGEGRARYIMGVGKMELKVA